MVAFLFSGMSFVFLSSSSYVVLFLTMGQFSLGASMSAITTGYYSLATLLFVEREAAMSCIESAVGIGEYSVCKILCIDKLFVNGTSNNSPIDLMIFHKGYIIGPILGSVLYDHFGYE